MEAVAQGMVEQSASGGAGGILAPKQEALCLIAAFTARGDVLALEQALNRGFDAGLTVNEAREAIVQLAYCGFPRCLNSLAAVGRVLDERGKQGKITTPGRDNTPIPDGKTSYDIGAENQRALFKLPQGNEIPLTRNAPGEQIINYYLRAHLFGDIFARDILDWPTRELVTISALSAMTGVEGQLRAHQAGGLSAGLTQEQVRLLPKITTTHNF
ncbi:MAG: carboxymuconolactone decarboxylase family protein [Treponema sp.]|nr:carboxymuconolactone decarboxylase family protein [Treponema sp.]